MDASQKTSWVTILIRLSACAMIGFGIMVLFAGVFLSHGTMTMFFAGATVIGFAAVVLAVNPRTPVSPLTPNPDATSESN